MNCIILDKRMFRSEFHKIVYHVTFMMQEESQETTRKWCFQNGWNEYGSACGLNMMYLAFAVCISLLVILTFNTKPSLLRSLLPETNVLRTYHIAGDCRHRTKNGDQEMPACLLNFVPREGHIHAEDTKYQKKNRCILFRSWGQEERGMCR